MKKDMTVAEKLEYEQKAVAIAASAIIGLMGALVGGMGIALAVIAGGAAMTAGGAIVATVGLGTLACAYPLFRIISGGAKISKAWY